MPKLLLMEADDRLAEQLAIRLALERIETETAASGREGLALLGEKPFDLAALSDDLPDMSGEALLIAFRERRAGLPVMVLSAAADRRRRIRYYRLGANDVLLKPPAIEELAARLWNLLRLAGKAGSSPLRVDDLRIDPETRTADFGGERLPLTPTEFDLLLYFARHEGRPLSRERIMEHVWGYTFAGRTNLVDVYVRYLRRKIDKKYGKKLFHTVRGVGYLFDAGKEKGGRDGP